MSDVEFIKNQTEIAQKLTGTLNYEEAVKFAKKVWELRGTNNKVIFVGNGASNTIAMHAGLDFMNQTGVQTICVSDPAILTAFSNDFGYEGVWERFCKIYYKDGDILVGVSSSGMSPNVVNAAKYVKNNDGYVVGVTGFNKDNDLNKVADQVFWVDSKLYNVVESIHNLWLAMICDLLIEWMQDEVGVHGINLD